MAIVNFKGLYGDNLYSLLPDFIHHEPLELRSKMYNWEIKEHVHTELFQLFILKKGQGTLWNEQNETKLQGPCIVLVPPNTLHGFSFEPQITGEVLSFSVSFLETIFKQNPKILLHITNMLCIFFDKNDAVFGEIDKFKIQIINELNSSDVERQTLVQALFQLVFIKIYRFSLTKKNTFLNTDNRTIRYFQAFQQNIKISIRETKTIKQYAAALNITTVHLNRICNRLVQKSALQIVQDYIMMEAKKYLSTSDYTIAEVSYLLNFRDPAYFTRLFKKHTGVPPSEFKKI
jgi:AraC family transcriptional regulator, transcriptional activator of pobA